jgi:dihydrolipoamide dehydrogenase
MKNYDVVVIGGGPGGYVAAIRAAQLGQKVLIIEKEHLGGVCLNWGCIPTKSLLKSAEVYQMLKKSSIYGINVTDVKFDLETIIARSREISKRLVGGITALLRRNKVTVINGIAKLVGNSQVIVDSKLVIDATNIVIATGARARILHGFEPNNKNIWTYKDALYPKIMPRSMVIVGSGAIGIEFASFYNTFGVDVTVLEVSNRILSSEDQEISQIARTVFEKKGIKFKTGIKLDSQVTNRDSVNIMYYDKGEISNIKSEILLMAVGIEGNVENIGLERTKVEVENGHILTNNLMQTAENNIYAIGDVAGSPWLAHKASHEGIIASEVIAGNTVNHKMNKYNIPGCTYSNPQIASVGLTEDKAKSLGYDIKVGRFPSYANGKALILGDHDGLVKTIFDKKTGELLGAHMIGIDVSELIQGYVVTKSMEGTEIDLINTIFPHPTLSEMMHESVLAAYGRQIHS